MELTQVMRTAGSTRRFRSGPVPDDVVHRVLDNARFAPSGNNRQGWRVIVVRERGADRPGEPAADCSAHSTTAQVTIHGWSTER